MKQNIKLGRAFITPRTSVEAGSYTSITFTYTAEYPIDDSGYIKICFRNAGDFGTPQFGNPAAPNYCVVRTSGRCHIEPRWDAKGNTRPFNRALFLQVGKGYLNSGDKVTIVFGDRSGGSPGWQMQTFVEDTFEFKTLVDPIATYEFKELLKSPTLRVLPGKPAKSLVVAPSQVIINQPFQYFIKTEDRWGNPVRKPVKRRHNGFKRAGIKTVRTRDRLTGLTLDSNPIRVVPQETRLHPYWADFHGQSEETIGSGSVEDYFVFAQNYGILDIMGHQGNDFQVTDDFWEKINLISKAYYQPGRFVTFPGYEWSGNTPLGGDRNVFFISEGGRISHSCTDLLPGKATAFDISLTARDLFHDLKNSKVKPFVFAHVGGRYADMVMHDKEIELAVEVHSAWGTFEWLIEDALKRCYRIGIVANSDDHKCRPGASYPGSGQFGSLGGLTCVLAKSLERASVYQALKARHCYATTGNRPLLDVHLKTSDGRRVTMGDILNHVSGIPILQVSVTGTAPLESIEVRNGLKTIKSIRTYQTNDLGNRIKIVWSGAEVPGRDRMTRWDGNLTVRDNAIVKATPINFWNANQPLLQTGRKRLDWNSNTTGGLSGIIVELERRETGQVEVETVQRKLIVDVQSISIEPMTFECGGLKKMIEIYRLPDGRGFTESNFELPLNDLHKGDNPIYVRIVQEDGNMAWSSPIYLVKV